MHEESNEERRRKVDHLSVQGGIMMGWEFELAHLLTAKAVMVFRVSGLISAGMKARMKLGTLYTPFSSESAWKRQMTDELM
jgi:hypothetical protein